MQIRTLKTFCDVVELHSFSEAAKVNHLTQSAVSQQISHIENEFGVRMIERAQRNLALTPAGEVFYRTSKDVLQLLESSRVEINELANVIAGTIKLESIYTIGLHDLPMYVQKFMSKFSEVKVLLTYRHSAEIYQDVLGNMAHLGVVAEPQKNRQLDIHPCWKQKMVVVVAPSHKLGHRDKINISELQDEPFIAFERNIPTRKLLDKILRKNNVQAKVTMTLDNVETIKRIVENGTGLSIVPENSIREEMEHGLIKAVEIENMTIEREIAVIAKKGRILSNAENKFIELLRNEFAPR